MRKIPLRRLLSKLTVLALSTSTAAAAAPVSGTSPSSQALSRRPIDDLDPDLEDDLPIDREHIDVDDAATVLGRSLAQALAEMRPIDAIHLATTWALSTDPVRRGAIARSLEWMFPLLADAVILEHLSHDPDPMIRGACARAAWVRRASGGDNGVLARLATDPDPEVRAIAARAR